jgi:hypothetical protein
MQMAATGEFIDKNEMVSGFELPLRYTCFPLGFPLHLETNSRYILAAAVENWGHFRAEFAEAEPVHLSLAVAGSGTGEMPGPPAFRGRGHLLTIVGDQDNQVVCDFRSRRAVGWVTPAIAQNGAVLRRHFLESSVMSMLVQAHLAPIHGALVRRNSCGILLCGPSCAGKSTLAFACARAGWQFISDDATFLVRDGPGVYAVGNPHTLSLREDIKHSFPEFASRVPTIRPGGKMEIEVRTRELRIELACGSRIDHVVFLDRTSYGNARLEPCDDDYALAWFDANTNFGEDHVRQAQRQAHRRLLSAGLWWMHYRGAESAVGLLDRLQNSNKRIP